MDLGERSIEGSIGRETEEFYRVRKVKGISNF